MHAVYRRIFLSFTTFAMLVLSFGIASPVFAQYGQYGGGPPSTQLSISKMVQDPVTGAFVKNISANGNFFSAGSTVTFRITVTNNGQTSFGFVDVTDTLPQYIDFVSGNGSYNSQSKQFTYRVQNLTPGTSDTRDIVGKIVAKENLPTQTGAICTTNAVSAVSNDKQTANDTAEACIGNKPVAALPSTGPALTSFLIFVVIGAIAFAGFQLRKAKH